MSNKKQLEKACKNVHQVLLRLDTDISSERHMRPVRDTTLLDEAWARRTRRAIVQVTHEIAEALGYERQKLKPLGRIHNLFELKKVPDDRST